MTKTMAVAEFAAHADELLKDVENGDEVVLTRADGEPFAKVSPLRWPFPDLSGSIKVVGDIVAPAFDEDEWDINR